MFDQLVGKYSENYALITDKGEKVKYADLDILTSQLMTVVARRSLVFCLCDNNIESLSGYFSFIKNDIVPLMLDSSVDVEFLHDLIKQYRPEYIWTPTTNTNQFHE